MAKIIGHHKLWYKTICDRCSAIILFENSELTTHNHIDRWNEPVYNYSTCICPECGKELSFNKYNSRFSENIDEPINEIQK